MARKRTSVSSAMNFNPAPQRGVPAGRRPVSEPESVRGIFMKLLLYACRIILVLDPKLKVALYFGFLLMGSIVCDILPVPKTYFARKDNFLNVYFVKWGWAWTLLIVGTYITLSSYVYCCGKRFAILRHQSRLLVATAVWFSMVNMFVYIESQTGRCANDKFSTRTLCLRNKFRWIGFDISGHCFLLIFSNLLMMEESKSLLGWERIGQMIRDMEFKEDLDHLSDEEKTFLKKNYSRLTNYVWASFVSLTALHLLWDVMLVGTVLYFHNLVQKISGGVIAIAWWYLLYGVWYKSRLPSPGLPGQGAFPYQMTKNGRIS